MDCALYIGKQGAKFTCNFRMLDWGRTHKLPRNVIGCISKTSYPRLAHIHICSCPKHRKKRLSRAYTMPINVKESLYSMDEENASEHSQKELIQPLGNDELKFLLADSERAKITRKLSEANQHNRFLKRQLHVKEEALVNFKSELAAMGFEIQTLAKLAEEIAQSGIPEGSRKINGKYIQSHLLARLEALQEKLKEQMKDVDAAQSKEVLLLWRGMAESVQVMGTFDGWSQGEHLSPEYDGSFTKFTTTLMLRPGRYEIKFLIDGEWHLSPEYPTIGDGLTQNNLLIVE